MKNFILAALSFIITGVCVALLAANRNKNSYLQEGMLIGTSLGICFCTIFDGNLALGFSLGMFIGETIGSF